MRRDVVFRQEVNILSSLSQLTIPCGRKDSSECVENLKVEFLWMEFKFGIKLFDSEWFSFVDYPFDISYRVFQNSRYKLLGFVS